MTSSEGEGQLRARKRSRTSANGDEAGNKKARGRPRVDTQDATAADRRRTQIRLAQRAYRQRKETTIASLKQENAQLQNIIEQMNTSFLRFNDSALKSGLLQLNPSLGQELKHVTETFVILAKSASEQSHDEDEEGDGASFDPAAELHNAARCARASREQPQAQNQTRNPLPIPQHTHIGWGYATTLGESPASTNTASLRNEPLQHSNFYQAPYETSNQLGSVGPGSKSITVGQVLDQTRTSAEDGTHQVLPFGLVDFSFPGRRPFSPPLDSNHQVYSVNIPSPIITPQFNNLPTPPLLPSISTKTLKPSWTYSHDETTFARRLTRATLEAGFHLLSGANLRPAALNYVFRLSLPYLGLEDLRARFKMMLGRSTEEELDFWDAPFIHLGGAGTHYPRKDARGNIIPIANSWTIRNIGPPCVKLVRAESTTDPSQNHDLNIDLTGFEGEWFDAYDVQGYLEEEKNCHIDPKDSFAEVLIEVEDESQPDLQLGSLLFSKKSNLDFSNMARPSPYAPDNPGLSSGSSSEPSASNKSTPSNSAGAMDTAFGQSSALPLGLDIGVGGFEFGKFNNINNSSLYDQPLGLDLAPGFGVHMNTTMAGFSTAAFGDMSNLGLDLMGGEVERLPAVKAKQKKAAWIDVTKFIDEMIKHAVCLGRAPGFRRKDVDMAFNTALISSF